VYHMFKEHWCGDDFKYSNDLWAREYRTNRVPVIPKNFFQPNPEEWYTVWSHVKMNTAGLDATCSIHRHGGTRMLSSSWDMTELSNLGTMQDRQGKQRDFRKMACCDQQDMSWRRYNNVSIDTLYFSVFFGGSSPSFRAKKDEVRLCTIDNLSFGFGPANEYSHNTTNMLADNRF